MDFVVDLAEGQGLITELFVLELEGLGFGLALELGKECGVSEIDDALFARGELCEI